MKCENVLDNLTLQGRVLQTVQHNKKLYDKAIACAQREDQKTEVSEERSWQSVLQILRS